MKAPAWFVVAVALVFQSGCRTSDWIERTLVTVDVTGVWEGSYTKGYARSRDVVLVLQQQGQRVTGEIRNLGMIGGGSAGVISIEGTVNGDTLTFREASGLMPIRLELQVNGDEMSGSGYQWNEIQMSFRRLPQ